MNKMKVVFFLALVAGLFAGPVEASHSVNHLTIQFQQEQIPHAVLVYIFDQLDCKKLCTKTEAETWYRTGELQITKLSAYSYKVLLPSGGIAILETSNL